MTLADDLLPTVYAGRAIAGALGFRNHQLFRVEADWTGQHTGEGDNLENRDEIVEADGQPPRVRWLKAEDIALGNLAAGSAVAGPITPLFTTGAGGGTDPAMFTTTGPAGTELYFAIVGPNHPTGAKYRVVDVDMSRPLRIMLTLSPSMNEGP